MQINLTEGNLLKVLAKFSVPFLVSSFLQTFYGLADLFITGQFNGADVITAVSVGSQLTHMLTVIIVGLTMGSTVFIGKAVGEKDKERLEFGIGNIIILFAGFAVIATAVTAYLYRRYSSYAGNSGRSGASDKILPCNMLCRGSVYSGIQRYSQHIQRTWRFQKSYVLRYNRRNNQYIA